MIQKYQVIQYKSVHQNEWSLAEVIQHVLNKLVIRIKEPILAGGIIEFDHPELSDYAEVINQNGCFLTVWNK